MLRYSDILKLKEEGFSLRSVASSAGNSRQKVTEVTERAKQKGLVGPFDDEMTDKWIEEFLFPEKSLESSGVTARIKWFLRNVGERVFMPLSGYKMTKRSDSDDDRFIGAG